MYFTQAGPANTAETIRIATEAARKRGIDHVVVASNSGHTAWLLQPLMPAAAIVCVTHAYGFSTDGENEMPAEERERLVSAGFAVFTGTHVLSGVERGMRAHFGGLGPAELIANTLRMLGQGTKVCVEIAAMAKDAGLLPHGKDIIAIGGTGRGADTALVLRPAHAARILDTKIREVLCKPAGF